MILHCKTNCLFIFCNVQLIVSFECYYLIIIDIVQERPMGMYLQVEAMHFLYFRKYLSIEM